MEENIEQSSAEDLLKDLPVQAEEISFKPEEMIACGQCARTNPPTRLKCFYCAADLPLSAEQVENLKPTLRKLENWESGFNVICRPRSENGPPDFPAEIGKMLRLENDVLRKILAAGKALPLARTESAKEAEIVQKHLSALGLETFVVGDERLRAEKFPRRLRGLEFDEDKLLLILFNTDEVVEIRRENFCLIVSGAVFQKSVESTEKRKKGESKILTATEMASDEFLVDLYEKSDPTGYRIPAKGFDFSCLEAEKGILARDNIRKLIEKLQKFAPHAKLVNDYLAVRELLGEVWEIEQRKDPQGLKRQSFGKFDFTNIASSNNLQQFTKYSRLQWHIL